MSNWDLGLKLRPNRGKDVWGSGIKAIDSALTKLARLGTKRR